MTENPQPGTMGEVKRREPIIKPVERRAFLRYGLMGGTGLGLGAFGAAALGFVWSPPRGGFGERITVPVKPDAVLAEIRANRSPVRFPQIRTYVVAWEPDVEGAQEEYGNDHIQFDGSNGIMALWQRCVHLGCTVPWCQSSQWFECPCHGSKYNRYGEWMSGPAPRGLDRFPTDTDADGNLVIDTGVVLTGPARTARVLGQPPEGPHCIDV